MTARRVSFWLRLLFLLFVIGSSFSLVHSFAPPTLGIGSLLFPARNVVIEPISHSFNKRLDVQDAGAFFVESFWTNKVGGGARQLSTSQRRTLLQSQSAEFNKRYGGRKRESELLLVRDSSNTIVGCVGFEVDRIPSHSLTGPLQQSAPLMSNLAIARQYRRRGLAERLVENVEEIARKQWGYNHMFLYVEGRNRPAIRLYKKLGYSVSWRDDTAKTLLPTKQGTLEATPTTIICMKKNLNATFLQRLLRVG